MVWCGVVLCGVVLCGVVLCGVMWCDVVCCGVEWCYVMWCGVVWLSYLGITFCGLIRCVLTIVCYGDVVVLGEGVDEFIALYTITLLQNCKHCNVNTISRYIHLSRDCIMSPPTHHVTYFCEYT